MSAIKVKSLGVVDPVAVRSMEEVPEWELLEMAVDSGAGETVLEEGVVKCVPVSYTHLTLPTIYSV